MIAPARQSLVPGLGEICRVRAASNVGDDCGIRDVLSPRDGHIFKLAPGPLRDVDEAPFGRLHVDGRLIVPVDDGPARQRRKLSFVGAVFVGVVLNVKQDLAADIDLITDGLPMGLEDDLREAAENAIGSSPKPRRRDRNQLAETIRVSVRRAADMAWGKKPVVKVSITQR